MKPIVRRTLYLLVLACLGFGCEGESQGDAFRNAASRGLAEFHENRLPDAIRSLKNAVELAPGDYAVGLTLGKAQYYSGAYSEAIKSFETVLDHEPRSMDARMFLAKARNALHGPKDRRALDAITEVVRFDSANIAAQTEAGLLALEAGDDEAALRALKLALQAARAANVPAAVLEEYFRERQMDDRAAQYRRAKECLTNIDVR